MSLKSKAEISPKTPIVSVKKAKPSNQAVPKAAADPTPNRTRSGRKIKPVENFYSFQSSLAMEALMKSNLLKRENEQTVSDSDTDQEVSFKENKPPIKSKSQSAKISTPKSNKKKRSTHRRCSIDSSDSDEDYEFRKKKKAVNKNLRTPRAPKYLKPAPLDTPCVIPLRFWIYFKFE